MKIEVTQNAVRHGERCRGRFGEFCCVSHREFCSGLFVCAGSWSYGVGVFFIPCIAVQVRRQSVSALLSCRKGLELRVPRYVCRSGGSNRRPKMFAMLPVADKNRWAKHGPFVLFRFSDTCFAHRLHLNASISPHPIHCGFDSLNLRGI